MWKIQEGLKILIKLTQRPAPTPWFCCQDPGRLHSFQWYFSSLEETTKPSSPSNRLSPVCAAAVVWQNTFTSRFFTLKKSHCVSYSLHCSLNKRTAGLHSHPLTLLLCVLGNQDALYHLKGNWNLT